MTKTTKAFIPLVLFAALTAAACSTSAHQATKTDGHSGILTGKLTMEGGPPVGGNRRPIPGSVEFIQHGRVVATEQVGADGRFSQPLPAGSYEVRACTSKIQEVDPNGAHVDTCGSAQAQVAANHVETVDVPTFIVP